MKPRSSAFRSLQSLPLLRFLAAPLAIGIAATSVTAGTQYWSGPGTWNTGLNWGAASGGPYNAAWTNGTADIAVFEGTGGAVTIGANRNADRLDFNVTGYTLDAGSAVSLTGTGTTNYNLAANVTATIGANVTLQSSSTAQAWTIKGTSKTTSILNLEGVIKNGTANSSSLLDSTVNVKSGGQLISLNSIITGTTTTGSGSALNIAGTVSLAATTSSLILNNTGGITADSSVTLSTGGNITFTDTGNTNGIRFGPTGAITSAATQLTGTVNLNGGTATLNKIFVGGTYSNGATYNSYVNLNGGTLKAIANQTQFMQGLTTVKVQTGGAIFDSNSFNITVGQALLADTPSGGLEKKGDGTLTLSASNTYTGDTLINNGTLSLSSTGGLKFLIGADDVNNQISGTGTVDLDGLFTFDLTNASTTINDSWNIVDVANLTESFGSNFSIHGFTADGGGILWSGSANGATYQFSETTGVLTVIPEPAAALIGSLGMLCLLKRRRSL